MDVGVADEAGVLEVIKEAVVNVDVGIDGKVMVVAVSVVVGTIEDVNGVLCPREREYK